MKALYEKYFKIGEGEKISDQKMLIRIVSAVIIIIISLLGMSVTSIAFFTASVDTASNAVAASTFYTQIAVDAANVTPKTGSTKYNSVYTVPANTECEFTLSLPTGTNTLADTGYCKISVGDDVQKCYYTQQFGTGLQEEGQTVNRTDIHFKVKTGSEPAEIRIQSCWGSCAYKPIIGEGYVIDPLYVPVH